MGEARLLQEWTWLCSNALRVWRAAARCTGLFGAATRAADFFRSGFRSGLEPLKSQVPITPAQKPFFAGKFFPCGSQIIIDPGKLLQDGLGFAPIEVGFQKRQAIVWIFGAEVVGSAQVQTGFVAAADAGGPSRRIDRKSTRLNSSHTVISYA